MIKKTHQIKSHCCNIEISLGPSNNVVTFGSLYAKDLPNGLILPEWPSTFHPNAKFLNDEKYVFHDYPPCSLIETQYLEPILLCPMAGNELPILLRHKPGESLKRHWKRWLPFFPEARIHYLNLEGTGESKCFTKYPLQWLPREKHAIDPDVHHKLLSKNTIPEMGANCPRHMTLDDYTVPCMIKASHGAAGMGTYLAKTKLQAVKIISKIQNELRCQEPSISQVIEDLTGNYTVQFYLYKTGAILWLGCTNQDIDEDFRWQRAFVDWNEQDNLKKKVYDTVMPVKDYLHRNGYFGVVGIDVLSNKDGNFVVDVNARINGCTPLLLIAPHIAKMGYPVSECMKVYGLKCKESEMIEKFDEINVQGEGMVINLASVETVDDSTSCNTAICIFAKNEKRVKDLHRQVTIYW